MPRTTRQHTTRLGAMSGAEMRAIRERLQLTTNDLAKLIRCSGATIRNLESGSVPHQRHPTKQTELLLLLADIPAGYALLKQLRQQRDLREIMQQTP